MQLISINLGREQAIQNGKVLEKSGIYKLPVDGPARVTINGFVGDIICDLENHGGVDQAVYVYGGADYDWWSQMLGATLVPGTFGENLTISMLESGPASIGDRLHIGEVILEVTAPRIPCATLAARMNDPFFVKKFRDAERPGFYCRVIQEGFLRTGIPVTHEPYQGERITILEMFRDWYKPDRSEAAIRRYLNAPVAIRARIRYEALSSERN